MELCSAATLAIVVPPPQVSKKVAGTSTQILVLMVEDDVDAAALIEILLTEDGDQSFRVEWTRNLVEAQCRLARPGVDVVLLDLGLPELTGYKCYRAIEAAAKELPVVIFTGDDRDVSRQLTLKFGAANYLIKGQSSPAELRQALHDAALGLAA